MAEIPNISQTTAMGSNNTQVGVLYNHEEHHHQGLSVADATSMAFAMFREYYPLLRQEALDNLDQMVTEKLKNLPAECIVPPTARITVPTIQKASITEEAEIREIYANLLTNSMNSVVKNGVHPSFVEIISQLSPDEAKVLRYMHPRQGIPTLGIKRVFNDGGHSTIIKDFSNVPELANCERPNDSEVYIDNLVRLGLARRSVNEWYSDEAMYEPLISHQFIQSYWNRYAENPQNLADFKKLEYVKGFCALTAFGKNFCDICLSTAIVAMATIEE